MSEPEEEPGLSEPIVVTTTFCTGVELDIADGHIRLVGWESLPAQKERRVVMRAILTRAAAERLLSQLQAVARRVGRGGH